jgi:D-alanyl-D-alanine carboxypeptidase
MRSLGTAFFVAWGWPPPIDWATSKVSMLMFARQKFVNRLCVFAAMFAFLTLDVGFAEARPQFSAITVDARTGTILYQNDADGLRHPASLTKMMTLYVLFQDLKAGRINRATMLRVSRRASSMSPSKLGLKAGNTISVDDAIKALVTKSANDVAATIGENLGGTESNFAARMTRVAHSIGMSRSTFLNASGLPNPGQYTTSRDMATLGLRLMRDFPQYYPYFRLQSFVYKGRLIRTHNRLIGRYEGTDGIKTGYIAASGYNLVTSTKRGDKRLVGVVLGATSTNSRNSYMMVMFEKMFPRAKDGTTVAALAGSSKGVVDPLAAAKLNAKPEQHAAQQMDTEQLTAAAASLAEGPVDTSGDGEDTADATPDTASTEPKVLEANLSPVPDVQSGKKKAPGKLPFAIKSASDAPNTLEASLKQGWNIQVGAYPNKQEAQAKLTAIQGTAAETLSGKSAYTESVSVAGKTVYRARFAGFDEASAKHACARIEKIGQKCLAVSPQS